MAKIPPVAPATEWMRESLVIVVWAPDVRLLMCGGSASKKGFTYEFGRKQTKGGHGRVE
jgi:hypothetical protein